MMYCGPVTWEQRILPQGFIVTSKMIVHPVWKPPAAIYHFHLARRLRPIPADDNLASVTHSVVTTCLDYSHVTDRGRKPSEFRKLQVVENPVARLLSNTGYCGHITPFLYALSLPPTKESSKFKVSFLIFKVLHGQGM